MKNHLIGLAAVAVVGISSPAARAQNSEGVPASAGKYA